MKFNKGNTWLQAALCMKYFLDVENCPCSGLSLCTKGGKLVSSKAIGSTGSQPQAPEADSVKKNKKQSYNEDTLVKVPTRTRIYTYIVVKTLTNLS